MFDDLVESVNSICIAAFGQEFSYLPQTSDAVAIEVTGILDPGAELEEEAPGDGSMYARLWLQQSALETAPVLGDQVTSGSTIYKVLGIEEDAGDGLWILLRRDDST